MGVCTRQETVAGGGNGTVLRVVLAQALPTVSLELDSLT